MADRPQHVVSRTKRRLIGLVVLGGLAGAGPALATDPPSSTDSQLRALSGSDAPRDADALGLRGLSRPERDQDPAGRASANPLVRPDAVDAADLTKALAAGNRTSRQLMTPEEDDAGSIGGALLAIAGLVLAVVVIARFNSARRG
jgi:hypothetical protein